MSVIAETQVYECFGAHLANRIFSQHENKPLSRAYEIIQFFLLCFNSIIQSLIFFVVVFFIHILFDLYRHLDNAY